MAKGITFSYEVPLDKAAQNIRQQKEVGSTVREADYTSKPGKCILKVFRPDPLPVLDEYVDCKPTFR